MAQTYQPQQVVFYNGVPYLRSGSGSGRSNPLAPYPAFNGMGSAMMSWPGMQQNRGLTEQQIQQLIARGQLSRLGDNPFAQKPSYEMKQAPMPTAADLPKPVGQRQDIGALLNGNQFAGAPNSATPGSPTPSVRPQMDFKQFGQNTMSKVLGGGV